MQQFCFQGESAVEGLRRARDNQDFRGRLPDAHDLPGVLRPVPDPRPLYGDRSS